MEGFLRLHLGVIAASGACQRCMHDQTLPYWAGESAPEDVHTCAGCAGIMASDLRAAASALLSASAMGCRAGATLGCCTPLVNPGSAPASTQLSTSDDP